MERTFLTVMMQLALIMVVARVCGAVFKKLGQPAVCGEMAGGLILGPSLFGRFFPGIFQRLFDPAVGPILVTFSQVGLVLLLFLLGMDFDFRHSRNHRRQAVWIAVAATAVPVGVGFVLAWLIFPSVGQGVSCLGFSLFVATALAITALPILGIILVEFGLNRTRFGVTAVTAAALMDVVGWILLAAVSTIIHSGFQLLSTLKMLLEVVVFVLLMAFVVRPLLKRWIRSALQQDDNTVSDTTLAILLSLAFISATITSRIGVFAIFGGFVLGAVLFDERQLRRALKLRMEKFVTVFFVPIFFMYTGLRTDVSGLANILIWKLGALVFAVATLSKVVPVTFVARLNGLSWRESCSMGVLMNTRGLMELVVLNIGYDMGVLPQSVFSVFVLMAMAATYMTSPAVRRLLKCSGESEAITCAEAAHVERLEPAG